MKLFNHFKNLLKKILKPNNDYVIKNLLDELNKIKILQAKQLINHQRNTFTNFQDAEFSVFSQWGDDGIIQYLIKRINIKNKVFIEFGVENYLESNTRFLLINNNWSGLVIDGSEDNINYIKKDSLYWKHNLKAKCSFITAENINQIITEEKISGEIGLLHIDIDGMDYWVWKAIDVVKPQIVIMEYNSVFGSERAITVPYKPDFIRSQAHFSNLYAGASLPALIHLANKKGYSFIGTNQNGNNAYFVKNEYLNEQIREISISEGYTESMFRESRDEEGRLSFANGKQRIEIIRGLEVYNVEKDCLEKI